MPRSVAPRTGAPEVTYAEEQEEYAPITVAKHQDPEMPRARHLLTRWRFTEEERAAIAAGEDLYVAQLNFGGPMTPLIVQVGAGWYGTPASLP